MAKCKKTSLYTNAQLHNTDVPTRYKCKTKISKKTATLISQLIMQKMQQHNTKKAQTKTFIHAKMHVGTHTLNICAKAQNSHTHPPQQTRPVVPRRKIHRNRKFLKQKN